MRCPACMIDSSMYLVCVAETTGYYQCMSCGMKWDVPLDEDPLDGIECEIVFSRLVEEISRVDERGGSSRV